MIEDVDYTASGYIQAIAPDGTVISRHRQEREAQQACFQHAKDNEDLLGDGVHDYILRSPDVRMSIRLLSVGGNPTNEDTTPPDPPAGVFNNSVTDSGFVTNWTNGVESDLQEHRVYRSSVGPSSGFSVVATVSVPTNSYSHTGLSSETQYWVYLTALDSSGNESVASSVVSSTTGSVSADPYDLSAYTVPFTYSWPAAPVTTQTINVPADMTISAAAATDGAVINVTSGDYGDVSPGNDQEWILSPGVTLDTFNYTGSQRVKLTCSTPRTATVRRVTADEAGGTTRDFLCDGVNLASDSGQVFPESLWSSPNGQRAAIVNCNIQSNSYAIFPVTTNPSWSNNLIVAGNYIYTSSSLPPGTYGNQHGIRCMSINTALFVGNYIEKDDNGQGLRLHSNDSPDEGTYDVFVAGNVIAIRPGPSFALGLAIQPSSGNSNPQELTRIYVEGNEIHNGSGGCIALQAENDHLYFNCEFNNNVAYGSLGLPSDADLQANYGGSSRSGNTSNPYNSGANIPSAASVLGWTP